MMTAHARATRNDSADRVVQVALDRAPVGLIILDRNRIVRRITQSARTLLGLDRLPGPGRLPLRRLLCASRLAIADQAKMVSALDRSDGTPQEMVLDLRTEGACRALTVDIRRADRLGWVISLEDVTQSRQTQDWLLEHLSSDPVTGLWNSHHFSLMLQDRLMAGRQEGAEAMPSVLLIGLRRLQPVHDLMSTTHVDLLLRLVGERLAACLRTSDLCARMPGDAFAAILANSRGAGAIAAACAGIIAALSQPFLPDRQAILLGIRIGVATAPQDGTTPDDLLLHAGLALQSLDFEDPPRADPSAWRLFERSLLDQAEARRAFEADLRRALRQGEFELHYQPQVDVRRNRVTGLEALVRWRHPKRGLVPPIAFIPLAEQLGLIDGIGAWVLHEACRAAAFWPDHITVAVNASPLQFEGGGFARVVADALRASGLRADRLEIEVTETLLLRQTDLVVATLARLQDLGVRLVLDDFGTGTASLGQLSRFQFDKIKIDRSFVSPVDASSQHSAIVRSIAALGQSLGIATIAEGVETARQLEQIKADGCTSVQGYFLSRPVPGADVRAVIDRLDARETQVAA